MRENMVNPSKILTPCTLTMTLTFDLCVCVCVCVCVCARAHVCQLVHECGQHLLFWFHCTMHQIHVINMCSTCVQQEPFVLV